MSNTKHTPGPWLVNDCTRRGSDIGLYRFRICTEEGRDADVVATVPMAALDDPVAEADARLIAAAPALLTALQEIATRLEKPGSTGEYKARDIARAAIAKATEE